MECTHEDTLEYGKTVFRTFNESGHETQVVQVRCTGCKKYGTVVERTETGVEDDWYELREEWHELSDYEYAKEKK